MRRQITILLPAVLLLAACTSSGPAFMKKETGADGAIYVYRVFSVVGLLAMTEVFIDDQHVASLDIDGYMVRSVPPGSHVVMLATGMSKSRYTFDVKSGGICIVRFEGGATRSGCPDAIPEELKLMKRVGPP